MSILLDNVDVDTESSNPFIGTGAEVIVFIRGDDFGGGSVKLSIIPPGDNSVRPHDIDDGVFTSDNEFTIDYLPSGAQLNAELTGSSGASNVFVEVK